MFCFNLKEKMKMNFASPDRSPRPSCHVESASAKWLALCGVMGATLAIPDLESDRGAMSTP